MDVNGTGFHLLTGAEDWEPRLAQAAPVDLWWDRERVGLSLLPRVLRYPPRASEAPLTAAQRRGADRDAFGNVYWIDEDRRGIRILPAGETAAGDYWGLEDLDQACPPRDGAFRALPAEPPGAMARLCGLAVTREHYLLVGSCAPGGLLIFDLHGGGPPRWWCWPPALGFAPFDLAAASDGGLWVLDRGGAGAPARLWRLDRHFEVLPWGAAAPAAGAPPVDFTPIDAPPPPPAARPGFPPGLALDGGSPLALAEPMAVEGLPDGSVLVLGRSAEGGHSVIQRYRDGLLSNEVALAGGILARVLEDPRVVGHDFAFLAAASGHPDEVAGELSLVLEDGNQALVFGLEAFREGFTLTIRPRYLPLRRYSGKALVAGGDAVYYDLGERWYALTEQPRRRHASEARLEGLVFDGREPGCLWHRLLLDACIPEGARVEVYSRAGEDPARLPELDWVREPAPYLRGDGAEIVLHRPFSPEEAAVPGTGTWELLFQQASGRYLELALVLAGDGRTSPRIRALRAYYPRYSYLERFLPAVYRQDAHSASFLDRYLANAEGLLSVVEDRIARAQVYLDSRTAPAEYLEWLADWLGAALDQDWEEARKRLLVEHAELLFRWRGTLPGMRAAIRLATEPCPDAGLFEELREPQAYHRGALGGRRVRIVERFLYRELPGVAIGDPTAGVELQTTPVSAGLEELGDARRLSERYRAYLQRRYRQEAGGDALAALNARWGSSHASFEAIVFTPQPPAGGARIDWLAFVQRELALSQRWTPEQGAYALHLRYQEFLRRRYAEAAEEAALLATLNARWGTAYARLEDVRFSPVLPVAAGAAEDWRAFLDTAIGFTYVPVTQADLPVYREFLARRYRSIYALNAAYGRAEETAWPSLEAVPLPAEDALPQGGKALADWVQFVSLMLPIRRNAHRFTVLVPTEPRELPDTRAQRIGRVEAIVRREKPAHTDYEVKLFWALFQAGSARLGEDTVLGESARYVAIVLGASYLGQGLLGHGQPWNVSERRVLGRDRLTGSSQ